MTTSLPPQYTAFVITKMVGQAMATLPLLPLSPWDPLGAMRAQQDLLKWHVGWCDDISRRAVVAGIFLISLPPVMSIPLCLELARMDD